MESQPFTPSIHQSSNSNKETNNFAEEKNIIYERYCFFQRCQQSQENLNEYVNDVISLAKSCEFNEYSEPFIRDRVIFGLFNETIKKEIIQRGGNPSLNDTVELCMDLVAHSEIKAKVEATVDATENITVKVELQDVLNPYDAEDTGDPRIAQILTFLQNSDMTVDEYSGAALQNNLIRQLKSKKKIANRRKRPRARALSPIPQSFATATATISNSGKREKCSICSRTFLNLQKHMKKCEIRRHCPYCERVMVPKSVRRHIEAFHANEHIKDDNHKYECYICKKHISSYATLINHMKYSRHVVHAHKTTDCLDCNKSFRSSYHLKRHLSQHRQCKICAQYFSNEERLKVHMISHSDCVYECFICHVQKSTFKSIRNHFTNVHTPLTKLTKKFKKKDFLCSQCGMRFKYKCLLKNHLMREDHQLVSGMVKPFECDTCHRRFTQANQLTHHRRVHTGEKPYKCEYCGKDFRSPMCLGEHRDMVHLKKKRYQCNVCEYQCYKSNGMVKHMMVHTGHTRTSV